MTEEEAKTKWCPMVRINVALNAAQGVGAFNRDGGDFDCIASDCMMWRWNTRIKIGYKYEGGYCGLGGKP